MAKSMTFLQLSQEFGGTRFGPFSSVEIKLGSDPEHSDITLPPTLGVAPQHVKVLKQQDETYILAPVERTAAVYFFRSTGGKGKQVTAPLACKAGDSFSLVTAEGPRFFIQAEKDKKAIEEAAKDSEGPGWPGGMKPKIRTEGIVKEIRRRGFAMVFRTRLGNMWMRMWTMVKTGQLFSARYIVAGMLMLSGWLFTFGSCGVMYRTNSAKKSFEKDLNVCRDSCGYEEDGDGVGDPTVANLARNLLGDDSWKDTLNGDQLLYDALVKQLRVVNASETRYKWVYGQNGTHYTSIKRRLEGVGLPENEIRVLAFAAAQGRNDQTWHRVVDSEGQDVCGRGPLALTYRQAVNLGLTTLQPDALVDAELAASNDVDKQRALLDKTVADAGQPAITYSNDLIFSDGAELQGGLSCLYLDGTDDRDNPSEVADALRRHLSGSASRFIKSEEGRSPFWIAHRLVALYTFDLRYDRENLVFDANMAPSLAMQARDVPDGRAGYALNQAAAVVARSLIIPCMARFDKDIKEPPKWFVKESPQLGQCAILKAYIEYDKL